MGILIPRDLRRNKASTAVWLASKRRNFIRNGGIAGLGPELQPNFDMSQGAAGWSPFQATLVPVVDGGEDAVLITSTTTGAAVGSLSISGLTIGKEYRVAITARRGVQGVLQAIQLFTWGTVTPSAVTTGTYQIYSFDIIATATSGVSRVYAFQNSSGGIIGDEVYVRSLSIREIL